MTPEALISTFGYFALFAGTVLEGETFLIIAVMLARNGHLDLAWVLVVAFIGAAAGDQCCFFLGRTRGTRLLAKRPHWKARVRRIGDWLERWETAVLIGYRFFYGLRAVTPFVIGMNGFRIRRFVVLSLAGTVLWLAVLTLVGIFFGHLALMIAADFQRWGKWLAIGAMIIGAMAWGWRQDSKKEKEG